MNDFSELTLDEITIILDNGNDYTKEYLATLGFERFGISKSKSLQKNKQQLIMSLRAAVNNEKIITNMIKVIKHTRSHND